MFLVSWGLILLSWIQGLPSKSALERHSLLTAIIGPAVHLISETVQDRRYNYLVLLLTHRKLHTGFQLVPKLVTLNDLEWCNGHYFVLYHWIWHLWGLIMSLWLKLDPYCLQQKCSPKNPSFQRIVICGD